MRALLIAATGMNAQRLNVEVIANNIANINSTAFKRARAEFSDLLYQAERLPGIASRGGDGQVPEGAQIGLGARTVAIRNLHTQGSLISTGNKLDLAIAGRGWFQVTGPDGEVLFTRAGSFNTNAAGQIVTADGNVIVPAMVVPANTVDISVNEVGQVYARVDGQVAPQLIGQISLSTFANETGLSPLGGNLYRQTTASGPPVNGVAGDAGFGSIRQSYLEASNVDPVKEIADLITAQRAYEMNAKVIQAADEMAALVSKGMR